ncbi:MAG: glycosyltransferase [Rudaea sp.]|uniref:glycosyltransferase family 2 protein n=1 Tax=unclassified Rudaea TaxID=2627037 RepID=UPI0010F583C3|nr:MULTISPECIES: glycosyltransferase [unclassified Rudaea]MBN8887375.1 glycosyltransferase [Rudaea sp.]
MPAQINADDYFEVCDPERLVPTPLVSVLMVVYNHGPYLAEAIESVMSQKCDFDYELVIGEDVSSDNSREIVLGFQRRYPDRIRVVCSRRNVGAAANHYRVYVLSRGEFVAHCEGDDYWCNPCRLSGQVALLRADAGAAVVHGDWVRAKPDATGWDVQWNRPAHRHVPRRFLEGDLFPFFYFPKILRNCTVVQRRSALEEFHHSSLAMKRYRFGDTVAAAYFTSRWRVAYWPAVAAVYRESAGSALRSGRSSFALFLRSALEFDTDARAFFRSRQDYPLSYRWECALGLLACTLRLRDWRGARDALVDLARHYGPISFVGAMIGALRLRWPVHRSPRSLAAKGD